MIRAGMVDVVRRDEKAGLRRDAVRSQVLAVLQAQEIKAVSYTHLDVYKRQLQRSASLADAGRRTPSGMRPDKNIAPTP